ncbi:hypothetical protein DFH11DRAFT_1550600 [Phellopilus nigrolimitatus]|nr:hypothetical protein DFH11DRAFT_1550600 [Phellopilus nigrolimitatus]
MKFSLSSTALLALLALAGSARAGPVAPAPPTPPPPPPSQGPHILPSPGISYPAFSTRWWGATHHNVSWSTKDLPTGQHFPNTALFLARNGFVLGGDLPGGENHPLATNFSLFEGRCVVDTPTTLDGQYEIMLFVDHGNSADNGSVSEEFYIRNFYDD